MTELETMKTIYIIKSIYSDHMEENWKYLE